MPIRHDRVGRLRHRVTLEAPLRLPDGAGGVEETWIAIATLWAAIVDRGGSERFAADAIKARTTHAIVLRPHDDLVPHNRLRSGPRVFHILSVGDADERGTRRLCLCEERDL
jgi:SPP1 family predicted phage head-tail adaptor